MTAKIHLVVGPSGRDNSERLIARYREVVADEIGAAVWIAPTERACDDILEIIARNAGVVLAPRVETFPGLVSQLCGLGSHIIPVPHQRMILAQLLQDLHSEGSIPLFGPSAEMPGFVDEVFGFISELKGLGVARLEFDEFARQRNQGHALTAKDREVGLIYARYAKLFTQHGFVDREAQYGVALKQLRAFPKSLAAKALFVDGFAAFTPPQLALLQELTKQVEEVWISLPFDESDEERVELYSTASDTLAKLHQLGTGTTVAFPHSEQRPAGLRTLANNLFRENAEPTTDASGLQLIEAPGVVGEVRMVARAVKELLQKGAPPADVLVCVRDMPAYGELLGEVFAEYGIPLDAEAAQPLSREPVVAALLAAARLDADNWPFAETTALLRSTLFRPEWPDAIPDTDVADAEILLRLLGEPRGREHYLAAARRKAATPDTPLEDDDESGTLRRRTHELAKRCLPFLEKLFAAWDDAPKKANFAQHAEWLQKFAEQLGFTGQEADAQSLPRLWHELNRWGAREKQMQGDEATQSRAHFLNRLSEIAAAVSVEQESSNPGCVRAVPADLAPALRYEHLFLLGLGEGSFPRLGDLGPLYDSGERNEFRAVGLDLRGTEGRLAEEMLLFHRLLSGAAMSVTLSYPAIDEKGQSLLPGTFLQNVMDCFAPAAIATTRRQMLVESVESQSTFSMAEYRVRWAGERQFDKKQATPESPIESHLLAAQEMVRERFCGKLFGAFDGFVADGAAKAEIVRRFGPKKKFSATALEDYVACPFRFFMQHVLRLEPVDDPVEEIEAARRGVAVHRAMASLHRKAKAPAGDVADRLIHEITAAVEDESQHASSAATRMLWQLENDRLKRMAARYARQWQSFLDQWRDAGITPAPTHMEAGFGPGGSISVQVDGDVIQLAGRIDRIDSASLPDGSIGFWVFDYKTGSKAPTSKSAAALERLQLAVYALAAEEILGKSARPLGLGYWLVAGKGVQSISAKRKIGSAWHDEPKHWQSMRERLIPWLGDIVARIRAGEFPLRPRAKDSCDHCSFSQACRINQSRHVEKAWELALPVVEAEA